MLEAQEFKIRGTAPRQTRVIVTGHLKGIDKDVIQELTVNIPAEQPNNDKAALLLWQEIANIGGLTVKETNEKYVFYSLSLFSHLDAEFQLVNKVSL